MTRSRRRLWFVLLAGVVLAGGACVFVRFTKAMDVPLTELIVEGKRKA